MSTFVYVALGLLALALVAYLTVRVATRYAREAGASETKAVAAEEVAKDARQAAEVRSNVAAASDDERRQRLRKWERGS